MRRTAATIARRTNLRAEALTAAVAEAAVIMVAVVTVAATGAKCFPFIHS